MNPEEMERVAHARAVKVIGGHKSQITRAMVTLEKTIASGSVLAEEVSTLKSARNLVQKQIGKIEAIMDELLGNANFAEDDLNSLTDYLLDRGNIIEKVNDILGASSKSNAADSTVLDATAIGAALSETLNQVQFRQLSQSDLPTFNGEESEYIPFIESFNCLVHENDNIPDVLKANYLKKCITEKGPNGNPNSAYDLLKHISPTSDNYNLMRERLHKRFKIGHSSRAIYITNLRKLSNWRPCHSHRDLRKLHDYITENLELLKLAGGSDINESDILLADVLALLPNFIVNNYLELSEDKRSLVKLLENIDIAVSRMFEKDMLVPKPNKHVNNKPNYNNTNNQKKPYVKPYYSYQANEESKCVFCGSNHSSFTCSAGSAQDRLHIAQEQRLCHNCLFKGHFSASCRYDSYCKCGGGRAHCKALCFRNNQGNFVAQSSNNTGNSVSKSSTNARGRGIGNNRGWRGKPPSRGGRGGANNLGNYIALPADPDASNNALADGECFMEIAKGYVKSATSNDDVEVRFLLDTGSNTSFGEKQKVNTLQCERVGVRSVNVSTLGGNVVESQDCEIVKLIVKDKKNYYPPTEICITLWDLGRKIVQDVKTWPLTTRQVQSIRKYQLSDEDQVSGKIVPIDILIGLDHYWKFVHRFSDDPGFGPVLRSTKLGWILSGQRDYTNPRLLTTVSRNPLSYCVQTVFTNHVSMPCDLSDKLQDETVFFAGKSSQTECCDEEEYNTRFSDLETFGIKVDQEISPILEHFNNTIKFNRETNRFIVRLPLIRKFLNKLEDGYNISKVRLDSLFSKIRNPVHSKFAQMYCKIIEEQESLGVIERVSDKSHERNACYIPHHGTFKKGSEKLRIVYDGSYKTSAGKININDCLSPGPSLTNELIEMLMRFRTHDVVLTADIEKAFLQIEVDELDRDYLRFLWYDANGELIIYRFTRVPFGLTSSSFLLNATLRYHMQKRCLEEGHSDLLTLLCKSHYVDDWIVGAKTPKDVLLIKTWLTEFLDAIGMKLHKLNSNSEVVRDNIQDKCPDLESVLGLVWHTSSDEILINIERTIAGISEVITKKDLYSTPPKVFDPLGICQPFIFQAKLLFKETCKLKLKWKEKLPTNIRDKFAHWLDQLHHLVNIKIPRQVVLVNYDVVELHGFGDASQLGYCACIYIVSRNKALSISRFVVSKTRVAPLKEMSIPRLELTAAFLLARLMALVIKFHDSLNFSKTIYYSDSMAVLHWIHSDHKQWTTYVDNRVRDINLLSSSNDWKYVKTNENPADMGTRGMDAGELVGNDFWMHGPTFLVSGRDDNATDATLDMTNPPAETLLERRKMVHVVIEKIDLIEQLLPPRKNGSPRRLADYSNIDQVFNVTGHLYKYIYEKIGARMFARWLGYELHCHESFSMIAEQRWVRAIQYDFFEKEILFCRGNPKIIPSGMKVVSSKVQQLGLFLDECGVLRVNTLLKHADNPQLAKEPMLLPKQGHFTYLIVWRAHIRLNHAGVAQTLAELRHMYWIPQGRQAVRNILQQCVKCRMMLATPFPVLAQPPLPDFRVQRVEIFSNTGVDFAGPFSISTVSGIKRKRKKDKNAKKENENSERLVYLIIFTCAVSRNVHSEVLDGMAVGDMMHGLRRFVSRYGAPTLFYSDNAQTFKCVARELELVFSHPNLQKYLNDRKITWKFYVEKAPWMGGFIERVVGLFKSSIKRVVGRAKLNYPEFITLICELNGMLNSRPISYVYDTVGEEEPITPSKLWCGKNITMFPPFYEARIDGSDPQICAKRLKYLDKVLTHFWNRFSTQYLTSLSERHLSRNLPRDGRQPKMGEMVLIKNDKLPRGRWKIARVAKVTPGPDGVIRRVELKLPHSDKRNSQDELNRPPRLLVPLECEVDQMVAQENK